MGQEDGDKFDLKDIEKLYKGIKNQNDRLQRRERALSRLKSVR